MACVPLLSVANFADAYSLLRKYRDDLFYYVYFFTVADNSDLTQYVDVQQLNEDEMNIWDWVHNKQKDLRIGSVLKCIASHPSAPENPLPIPYVRDDED